MPESDNMKENKETTGTTGANMVGQVITGVIDGLFDAGYLVKVKVGDSDTPLRGLVFLPSRFIPITAANDVAQQAKKNRRADIPIPVSYPPTQLPSFVTSPEQSDKQLVELKKLAPTAQDEGLQSGFQPTVPTAKESQSAPQMLPLTEYLQSIQRSFLWREIKLCDIKFWVQDVTINLPLLWYRWGIIRLPDSMI